MDQILVDAGEGASVRVGEEVVLLGTQGDQTITAWEWAERLDTVAYEILCGIGERVPRRYVGGAGLATSSD
jgi:alanine racemase